MELAYITDPGHGWLLVTTGQLAEVDLTPTRSAGIATSMATCWRSKRIATCQFS
jgi:hypothetical protein